MLEVYVLQQQVVVCLQTVVCVELYATKNTRGLRITYRNKSFFPRFPHFCSLALS